MKIKQMTERLNSVPVRKKAKRILALMLAVLMVNPVTGYGVTAHAQEVETITAFAKLSNQITIQQLAVGAEESDINLPDTLNVTLSVYSADTAESIVKDSQAEEIPTEEVNPDESTPEEPAADEFPADDSSVSGNDAEEPQEDANGAEDNTATDSQATVVFDSGEVPLAATATGSAISADLDDADDEQTETEKITSEERTLTGITWQINVERSGSDTFDSESAGAVFYYEPVLPEGYTLADGVSLPEIQVQIEENVQWAFSRSTTIDGVEITVKVEKDVFPKGAVLHAEKVTSAEDKEKIQSAVSEEVQSVDVAKTVKELVSFDITITDADGNELQPDTSKGEVRVSFAQLPMVTETAAPAQELKVFHMDDSLNEAEGLDTTVDEATGTLEAPVEHFSLYTVALLTATAEDGEASVTDSAGTVTYYDSIKIAVETAVGMSDVTVTLLKDTSGYVPIVDTKGSFILDLNGKTWDSTLSMDVGNETGSLRVYVKDSVGGGKLKALSLGKRSSAGLEGGYFGSIVATGAHSTTTIASLLEEGCAYKNPDGTLHEVTSTEEADRKIQNVTVKRQILAQPSYGQQGYYRSIQDALVACADNGGSITLLDDIIIDSGVTLEGKSWTIDFNGKKWTYTINIGNALTLSNVKGITLKDSKNANGTSLGGLYVPNGANPAIFITGSNTESIHIESGNYTNGGAAVIGVDESVAATYTTSTRISISGGNFSRTGDNKNAVDFSNLKWGEHSISGGTFHGIVWLSNVAAFKLSGGAFDGVSIVNPSQQNMQSYLSDGYCYQMDNGDKTSGIDFKSLQNVKVIPTPIKAKSAGTGPHSVSELATVPLNSTVVKTDSAVGEVTYQWYQGKFDSDGRPPADSAYIAIEGATTSQYYIKESLHPGTYIYKCMATCDGLTLRIPVSGFSVGQMIPKIELKLFEEDGTEVTDGQCTTDAYFKISLTGPDGERVVTDSIAMYKVGNEGNSWNSVDWSEIDNCYKTSAIGNYNIGTFSVKAHFFDLSNPTYYTVWSEPFTFTATKVKKNQYPLSSDWQISSTIKYGTGKLSIPQLAGGPSPFNGMWFCVSKDNGVLSGTYLPEVYGEVLVAPFDVIGAGTVTVTAVRKGNDDYYDATVSKDITIAKGDAPTITWPTANNIVYGQKLSESALSITQNEYGSFAWKNGDTVPSVANSGYEVTFKPSESTVTNYETILDTTKSVSLAVTKANPAVTLNADISGSEGNRQAILTATITGVSNGESPTGTVKFVNSTSGSDEDIAGATVVTITGGKTTYTWTGLASQIYKVKAVYSGSGNYNTATSEELSFDTSKKNQDTLSISEIGAKTYGDGAFTLSATGGSVNGAASFTSSDPTIVSISGATATIHKAGTVTITATKVATDTYNEATVSVSLTVGKKTLSVKADDKLNIIKGMEMLELTYTATGLVGSDTFTSPGISTTAADTNTVGEYDILISGGTLTNADSYAVTYTNGKLTVVNATYTVTAINGTGGGSYSEGQTVTIKADSRSGYTFTGWSSSDSVTFANSSASTTTFTMPGKAVTITANYSKNSSDNGGGSSSGGSSTGGSSTSTTTTTPEKKPNQPVTASAPVTATVGANGAASASVPDKAVTDAIAKAQSDATRQGKTANGISVELDVTMPKGTASLTATLTRSSLNSLVSAGVSSLEINGSLVQVSFDKKALAEIQKQSSGNISIAIAPKTKLSGAAKKMIGTRPVYDITVGYGSGKSVSSFGGGVATVSIPYTLGKNEAVGGLYGVYVDAKGNANRIAGSTYDTNSGCVIFTTTHFSQYGIGYTAPTAKFTDISTHWAKESVDYVVGRGLLSGTSDTAFSPNSSMTRGMLVTALGRLAGVDTKAYTGNSFTDVNADSAYRPYIEWAYSKGIIQGIGGSQFAPDRAITREEIAVIFTNYAKATGYTLPITREATTYADASSIGSAYKDAVKAMQQAGIMMGGSDNKFNPKGNATRAEVSSMLNRYIKLTINPDTAQGWTLNDAGQYLYYKDGKALTDTQTIDGVKYFFNSDGTLKTGWVKDGDNWRFYSGKTMLVGFWDLGANGNNKTYYFTKDGLMVSGKWLEIDGKWYYFNTDGSLARSTKIDGYEVDEKGVRKAK